MRITLPSGTPAELVRPDSADSPDSTEATDPARGLVVIPDIFGLRPLFDDLCAQLARENNLVVCAPEPFPDDTDRPIEWRLEHLGDVSDERRLGDALAAADATGCDTVGLIGFCMGGMYALKGAGTGRFNRAVAFYGMIRVPENWRVPGAIEPLDAVVAPNACPVMAIIGTADIWTPPDDVNALEATGATVVRYEGADHGFVHDPSRPTHRPDDAADAWQRALAFLAQP